jgi:hypothetical protein
MACMVYSPPRQSGRFKPQEPFSFDIGADRRFRHSAPSESGEKKLVPRRLIADAPGIETHDSEVPARARRLLRKNKLDEIARLTLSTSAGLGQRMIGRRHEKMLDVYARRQRIVLDEQSARLDQLAHQFGEHIVDFLAFLDLHLQQ